MGRFSGAFRSTGAGSTTLPLGSIFAPAGNGLKVKEVHAFNTTAVATDVGVRVFTALGTAGAAEDELPYDADGPAATATLFNTHTVTPTITAGQHALASLGAAIGSGVTWTFFGRGLIVPSGTGNGLGVIIITGTGQICDLTFVWEE